MLFKKKKKILTDEEFEIEVRKDIFWKALFIFGFLTIYIIGWLHGRGWDTPTVDAIIVTIAMFMVYVSPRWFYDKVKQYYDVFHGRNVNKKDKGDGRFIYNMFVYIPFAFFAYFLANSVNLLLFHKNRMTDIILILIFNVLAFFLSVKLSKSKVK